LRTDRKLEFAAVVPLLNPKLAIGLAAQVCERRVQGHQPSLGP
jgi:hypothetical protein